MNRYSPDLPQGPEYLSSQGEQITKLGIYIQTQAKMARMVAGQPPSPARDGFLEKSMGNILSEWARIVQMHVAGPGGLLAQAMALQPQIERLNGLPETAHKELREYLQTLINLSSEGERLNPLALLAHIDTFNTKVLAPLEQSQLASVAAPLQSLLYQYLQAMVMPGVTLDPGIMRFNTPVNQQNAKNVSDQEKTILRLGATLLTVPVALFFGIRALTSENGEGATGAALWTTAALAAAYGYKLNDSRTQGFLREITYLTETGVEKSFPYLQRTYAIHGQPGVDFLAALAKASTPVQRLIDQKTPLTAEQLTKIQDELAPGGSPFRDRIPTMIQNGDLASLSQYATRRHSRDGERFVHDYVMADARPELLARGV